MNASLRRADLSAPGTMQPIQPPRVVANLCNAGNCPTVYENGPGTLLVQGSAVSADLHGIDLPSGEILVEIPAALLAEALRNIS